MTVESSEQTIVGINYSPLRQVVNKGVQCNRILSICRTLTGPIKEDLPFRIFGVRNFRYRTSEDSFFIVNSSLAIAKVLQRTETTAPRSYGQFGSKLDHKTFQKNENSQISNGSILNSIYRSHAVPSRHPSPTDHRRTSACRTSASASFLNRYQSSESEFQIARNSFH